MRNVAIVHAFVHSPPPFSMPECAVVSAIVRSIVFKLPQVRRAWWAALHQ